MNRLSYGVRSPAFPGIALPLLALLLLVAPTARAQGARSTQLLLAGGVAFPNGSYLYRLDTGYQLQGALELTAARKTTALRVEALYNRFGFSYFNPLADCVGSCPAERAHESTLAGTLNAVLAPRTPGVPLAPYFVVGAGAYKQDNTAVGASSGTKFGLNGGVGFRIPGLHAFIEAREHVVKNAANYLPITAGIRF